MPRIGKIIRYQRKKIEMTQQQASELIGISRTLLCAIETGRSRPHRAMTMLILSKLGTTRGEVLREMNPAPEITTTPVAETVAPEPEASIALKDKLAVILENCCSEIERSEEKRIFELAPGVQIVVG